MVQATHIVAQAELRATLARAAITLAQREAEKHVKRGIAARGHKPPASGETGNRSGCAGVSGGAPRADHRGE
jgi:hypothetical protein